MLNKNLTNYVQIDRMLNKLEFRHDLVIFRNLKLKYVI